jgi:hypothetical protein
MYRWNLCHSMCVTILQFLTPALYYQRGAASIDRIRSSLSDATLSPDLEPAVAHEQRTHKGATVAKSHKISYVHQLHWPSCPCIV